MKRLSDELSSASGDGDLTKMKDLIALGADINGRCCGPWPPINAAIESGHTDAVKLLINNGANVNADAKAGTPILRAIVKRNVEIVRLLLEKGANPNIASSIDNVTAMKQAQENGDKEIIDLLKKYSAPKQ